MRLEHILITTISRMRDAIMDQNKILGILSLAVISILSACSGGSGGSTSSPVGVVSSSASSSSSSSVVVSSSSSTSNSSSGESSVSSATSASSSSSSWSNVSNSSSSASSLSSSSAASSSVSSGSSSSASSVSSSSSSEKSFYITGIATATGIGGKDGLFVIPSNSLTTPPIFITNNPVMELNPTFPVPNSLVAEYRRTVFASKGSDAQVHLYYVLLNDTASVPTPVQISNLTLSSLSDICGYSGTRVDVTNPDTEFYLLQLAGPNGTCKDSDDIYEVVHVTDDSNAAPSVANVDNVQFDPIHTTSGLLSGVVILDSVTNDLEFFAGTSFSNPVVLSANVNGYEKLINTLGYVSQAGGFSCSQLSIPDNVSYFRVTKYSGDQFLYKVDENGVASVAFSTSSPAIDHFISDSNNLFFDTVQVTFTSGVYIQTATIVQLPFDGTSSTNLYTLNNTYNPGIELAGSDGASLVFNAPYPDSSAGINALQSIPLGSASTTAQVLTTLPSFDSSLCRLNSNDPSTAVIIVNAKPDMSSAPVIYRSAMLSSDGTLLQPWTDGALFVGRASDGSGRFYEVNGITDTNGGYGGASLYDVTVASWQSVPFKTSTGDDFVIPNNYTIYMSDVSDSVCVGGLIPVGGGDVDKIVCDKATHEIVTISMPNTSVY